MEAALTNHKKYVKELNSIWESGYNFGVDKDTGEPMDCSCDYKIISRCNLCKFYEDGDCPSRRAAWLKASAKPELVRYPNIIGRNHCEVLNAYLGKLWEISVRICQQHEHKCEDCPFNDSTYSCGAKGLIDCLLAGGATINIAKDSMDTYIEQMNKLLDKEDNYDKF